MAGFWRVLLVAAASVLIVAACTSSAAPIGDLIALAESTCREIASAPFGTDAVTTIRERATTSADDLGYSQEDLDVVISKECPSTASAIARDRIGQNLAGQNMGIMPFSWSLRSDGVGGNISNGNDSLTFDFILKIVFKDESGSVVHTGFAEINDVGPGESHDWRVMYGLEQFDDVAVSLVGMYIK